MFTPKWEILSGQNPFNSMAVSIVKVLRKDKVNSKMFTPINIRLILNRKTIPFYYRQVFVAHYPQKHTFLADIGKL